ncbi:DUF2207 domain-containing protein [Actinomadura namibiensis]|uniref:DUF2207 domain-containing protein n=1 Tax=Actinomadura namibiensis TaxID=182080 RepID=A0A7W3QLA6_ACTNM|nr:DUF2207 domain-containing protein [Actinomadura namibiensis]MBA8951359.1 hypothetical protein [Actinomadura namibiensis]
MPQRYGGGMLAAAGVLLATVVFGLPARADAAGPDTAGTTGTVGAGDGRVLFRDSVPTFDVRLAIGSDAVLRVRETITYDFTADGGRGIIRRVPYRKGRRLYEVRNVRSGSSTGAPARVATLRMPNSVRIRVGDEGRKVRGRQAYVIEYEVAGAFTRHPDRDELVWDAVGDTWEVPIGEAAVRVEAPVPLRKAGCHAGRPPAVTRCLRHRDGPFAVDFTQTGLRPREGMVVRVRLPRGAVAVPPPRYARPHWRGTWLGPAALALALGGTALVARRRERIRELGRRPGALLLTSGIALVVADAGTEVVADGPWEYGVGDMSVTGIALGVLGAAVTHVHRSGASDNATVNGR